MAIKPSKAQENHSKYTPFEDKRRAIRDHSFVTTHNRNYLVIWCSVCALVAQDWSTSDVKRAEIKKNLEANPYCLDAVGSPSEKGSRANDV